MKKKYQIIIDVTGKPPVVEAESVVEAEKQFVAGVTAEQFIGTPENRSGGNERRTSTRRCGGTLNTSSPGNSSIAK